MVDDYVRYNSLKHNDVCGFYVEYNGIDLRKSGVYAIECITLDKMYVGATRDKIRDRWGWHIKALRDNKHSNKYLQEVWNSEGEQSFRFIILEYIENTEDVSKFNEREEYFIKMNEHRKFNFSNSYVATRGIVVCEEQVLKICKDWVVVSPTNEIHYITNLKKFCRENDLCQWTLSDVVARKKKSYRGWLAYKQDEFTLELLNKDRVKKCRVIELIDYDDNVFLVDNLAQFCKDNKYDLSNLYRHLRGEIKGASKRWKSIRYIPYVDDSKCIILNKDEDD